MVGDAIFSKDSRWQVVYLFINSKIPQYIVYRDGTKVFPLDRAATTKKKEVLEYLLSQDPTLTDEYLDHHELMFVENGCIDQMTDASDLPVIEIVPAVSYVEPVIVKTDTAITTVVVETSIVKIQANATNLDLTMNIVMPVT